MDVDATKLQLLFSNNIIFVQEAPNAIASYQLKVKEVEEQLWICKANLATSLGE